MIKLKQITKRFSDGYKPVIDGLDLSVEKGEFIVLIGANGCGKSTLLKLISKEYCPDSGEVCLNGEAAQVVQDVNLGTVPELTLLENMALCEIKKPKFRFYHRYKPLVKKILQGLNFGLEQAIDKPLAHLSGGQKQMIATAMAIQSKADILLLDEHTSALDPRMQAELMAYTAREIEKNQRTALMITHQMEDAIHYGTRLLMLHQGRIVFDVSGKEKQRLTASDLLALFHQYEDKILRPGGVYDH